MRASAGRLLRPWLANVRESKDSDYWAGVLGVSLVLAPVLLIAGFLVWLWLQPDPPVAGPGCSDPRGHTVARTDAQSAGWTVSHLDDPTMAQCDGTAAYTPVANLPGNRWLSWFSWQYALAMTGPARCGFYIHIPAGSYGGGPARYYVGQIGDSPVGGFTVDQARYAGRGPYESPEFRLPDPHHVELLLVNAGRGTYTVVASAAVIHCAPA